MKNAKVLKNLQDAKWKSLELVNNYPNQKDQLVPF